ncbi:MAG: hypothetical protein KDB07_12515, partial [Planctomycetes bacterium]|nr:hypothetical protein [Planctomycetota bacterium]
VDGGTADAAEVFAAALQDNGRAKLVGQYSFGRAIIQKVIPLQAKEGKHALLLTVGKYYTPEDQSAIHNHGLAPDTEASPFVEEGWVFDELDIVRESGAIKTYVQELITKHEAKAIELAKGDGESSEGYPEFAALVAKVKANKDIHLEEQHLRRALRSELRLVLSQADKLSGGDLQEDHIFMSGLETLAKSAGVDLSKFDAYKAYLSKAD